MPTRDFVPYYKVVLVATPAAGANFVMQSPGSELWRVISLAWTFTADANVADRSVSLLADDATDVYFRSPSRVDVAAGQASPQGAFSGATAGGFALTGAIMALPTDGLMLLPGYRLRSTTVNIQVGDAFTAIRALVQAFPTGPGQEFLPTLDTQISQTG